MSFNPSVGSAYLIIDGQQRLTTLAGTLLREKEPEAPGDEDFLVFFDLDKAMFTIPRPKEDRPPHWLPLNEILNTIRFLEWLERLPRGPDRERFVQAANRVARSLRDYKVPVYVVRSDDEGELRTIFERMNNSGKALAAEEIFRAIRGKRDELDNLQESVGRLGFGAPDKEFLLKTIYAMMGIMPRDRRDLWTELRARPPDEQGRAIGDVSTALGRVVQFLRDDALIPHIDLLPCKDPVLVLTKLFHLIPDPSGESRAALSEWLWRNACAGRHSMNQSHLHATLKLLTNDERSSVRALSAQTKYEYELREPAFRRHDFRSAETKLLCNALVALRPRNIESGELIVVDTLLVTRRSDAFEHLVPRRRVHNEAFEKSDVFRGTSNRIVHPHIFDTSILDALRQLEASTNEALCLQKEDILSSHGIDMQAAMALRVGDYEKFLVLREATLQRHAVEFFRARCGLGMAGDV